MAKLLPHIADVDLVPSFAGLSGAGEWWRGRGGWLSVAAWIVLRQDPGPVSNSERRQPSSRSLEAVAALSICSHRTADRFYLTPGAGRRAGDPLDIVKNLLRSRLEEC
jgi:hypothetical protein